MKSIITCITIAAIGLLSGSAKGQIVFSEDFEGITVPALPALWTQENLATTAVGWASHNGAITLPGSGVDWTIAAHTNYAVVNDWNNSKDTNNPCRLITPPVDISTLTKPHLYLDYYYVGVNNGTIAESFVVEASTDNGANWTVLKALSGNPDRWQKDYIDLKAYNGATSIMFAFKYSDDNLRLVGAAVDNIKVLDPAAKDIETFTVTPLAGTSKAYQAKNTNFYPGGELYNEGTDTITSYTIHYRADAGPVVSDVITGVNIAPFTYANFAATTPYTIPATLGDYKIEIWLELTGDNNAVNDTGVTTITAVDFIPKKKILAEEGTGTWCGYCPRGHVYMDSIAHSPTHNNSFSLVAVHNNDPMAVLSYDNKIGTLIGGYPSMVIDRWQEVDPSELFDVYDEQKDNFGFADIILADVPASGFNYSVKVSVKPALDLTGDYRLALVLTEDDVTGTGSKWAQSNYYSYQANNQPLRGAGLDWQAEPSYVPAEKMHYNHVGRGIFPNPNGAAASLPATMTAGTTYDYTFNVPMEPYWHRYNNQMHAIVMLIRNADGHVLNSQNIVVPLGLSDVDAGVDEFTVYPNPASNTAYVNFSLAEKGTVKVIITDAVGRAMYAADAQDFAAGKHRLNINLFDMSTGIYNVTLITETGKISTRLSVVK